jgi:hypothetical protein
MTKLNYCTQNNRDCETCSLVNYRHDCQNNPIDNPICPDCNSRMSKAGLAWSGTKKVQRWRCQKCGKTTIKVK